jgi:hypothetical protein
MLGALAAIAIAGCGDEDASPSKLEKKSIPATIVSDDIYFFATDTLNPISNAWRVSNRKRFTQVEAGAMPEDDSIGVFAIFRHSFRGADQRAKLVKVVGAGKLEITDAPTGAAVESSAQHGGKLKFSSSSGVTGTLDLSDDSVHLKQG